MSWDLLIGLMSLGVSLTGILWNRDKVKKFALLALVLLASTVLVKGISYQWKIRTVQSQIIDALGASQMSAEQLYGEMDTVKVTRLVFNDALSRAVENREIGYRQLDLLTIENSYIEVRVYFIPR